MPKNQTPGFTVQDAKRRRPTTACTTCRDRRVKCDRVHPTCSGCKKGGHHCKYFPAVSRNIAFVPELHCASNDTPPSTETWSDVFARQIDKSIDKKEEPPSLCSPSQLVEKHETETLAFSYLSFRGPPIDRLGDNFAFSFRCRLLDCENCTSMLESYLLSCHRLVPICDMPSLKDIFALPWTQIVYHATVETMVLICAVLYAASSTNPEPSHSCHAPTFLSLFQDLTRQLEFCDYFTAYPSIPLLQGYLIFNTFRACHLAPFAAFGFLPQAVRFAQMLSLHQDQEGLHRSERELRRRTWWHVVFLDIEASVSSGLQNIIRPCDHNIPLPVLTKEDMGLAEADKDSSAVVIAMQAHWLLAQEIHQWLKQRPSHVNIIDFGGRIETLVSRIGGDSTLARWAQKFLQLQIDRAYCMAGLQFWKLDQFKRTSCGNEAVCTARSFLRSYLDLIQIGRDIAFEWFIPGFIQPIHALMILLKHLSGCSNPECENSEKTYELLTQVIDRRREWIMRGPIRPLPRKLMLGSETLSTHGVSVTRMTDPRYRMLWAMKEEVWRRFGWTATIIPIATTTTTTTTTDYGVSGYPSAIHDETRSGHYDEKCQGPTSLSLCEVGLHFPTGTRANSHETSDIPCNLQSFGTLNSSNGGESNLSDKYVHLDNLDHPDILASVNWDSWLIDFE